MSVDPNQKKMLEVAKKIKTSRLILRDSMGFGLPIRDRIQNLKLEIPQRQSSGETDQQGSQQSPQQNIQKRLAETREKLQNRPKLLGLGGFFKQQPSQEELKAKAEAEAQQAEERRIKAEAEAKAKEKRDREASLARAKESMSIGDI